MATLQYIGARYVPLFYEGSNGSEWDSGVSYEPLTIVTYIGSSWTSKKRVPSTIGAPNLNPEYWVNTGNFNAQIESFIETMSYIQEEVNGLSGDVVDLSDDVLNLRRDIFPIIGSLISPKAIGVYDLLETQNGSVCRYNDTLWTIEGVSNYSYDTQLTNMGVIHAWNYNTGELIGSYNVEVGHANGACYCPETNCLYVCGVKDYTQADAPTAGFFYKIPVSTMVAQKVYTGAINANEIAYDYRNNKMYIMMSDTKLYNYNYLTDTFTECCDFSSNGMLDIEDDPYLGPVQSNEIAIWGNTLVWANQRNQIGVYKFEQGKTPINVGQYNVSPTDVNQYWFMGELEGLCFDDHGKLICTYTIPVGDQITINGHKYRTTCNFICEISTSVTRPNLNFYLRDDHTRYTYSVNQVTNSFLITSDYSVNSFMQLLCLVNKPSRVTLNSNFNFDGIFNRIIIESDVIFNMNGKTLSNFNGFIIYKGKLTISGNCTINLISGYNGYVFETYYGDLVVAYGANITITGMDSSRVRNFINTYTNGRTIIDYGNVSVNDNYNLYVGSYQRHRGAMYCGDNRMIDPGA